MRSVDRIELGRFDRGEVAAQLAAILGDEPGPGLAGLVFDRSGGNAYLVEELAGVVRAGGDPDDLPPSLRDVLLSRVDALSDGAQRLLRTASVAGRRVPDVLLAEVAGIDETRLYDGLREAVENHLLLVDPSGHGYAFRHALTRDAVYEDMLPGERCACMPPMAPRWPGTARWPTTRPRCRPRWRTTGMPRWTCRGHCPPRSMPPAARWSPMPRRRRCCIWSGRWRSGPGRCCGWGCR